MNFTLLVSRVGKMTAFCVELTLVATLQGQAGKGGVAVETRKRRQVPFHVSYHQPRTELVKSCSINVNVVEIPSKGNIFH